MPYMVGRISRRKSYLDAIFHLKFRVLGRMIRLERKYGKIGYIKGGIMIPAEWMK